MPRTKPHNMLVGDYPPPDHMLRDLGIVLEPQGKQRAIVRAPVVPETCTDQGTMCVGVIAALVDLLGGALALNAFHPDWLATTSLSLYTSERARAGMVTACGSVLRAGKTSAVVEVDIAQEQTEPPLPSKRLGSAIMTFSKLRLGGNTPTLEEVEELEIQPIDFAMEGSGLKQPILDKVAAQILNEAAGEIEVTMGSYIRNSFGALQGGLLAILADAAGQQAARAATGKPMITSDLNIHYLSQGKTGPFRTRATVLRETEETALTRVEVFDCGADDRLITIIMNTAILADS